MRDATMIGASKANRNRRASSSRRKHVTNSIGKSLLDTQTSSATTTMDPPSTNLEVMADCVRPPPADVELRRPKIKGSPVSANFSSEKSGRKNDRYHASGHHHSPERHHSPDHRVSHHHDPSNTETLSATVSSLDFNNSKLESRHPSPVKDRPRGSSKTSKTRSLHHQNQNGGGGFGIGDFDPSVASIVEQLGGRGGGSKASWTSSRSDESAPLTHNNRPPASIAASRKTAASSSSTAHTLPDIKLSSERLEVLVMQLRDTTDEKEAATIVLEFALRIKNHELVVQGADLSIINAMKRFSNSSKIQMRGCKALAEMAGKGMPNIMSIIDKGGSEIIMTAMAKHRAEEDLQKEACRAIECIARESDLGKQSFGINAKDGVLAILHAMKDHPKASKLQRMACRALASIAADHSECSQCLVSRGGLEVIRRTLKHHDDNTEVIENAFDILINVASAVKRSALDEEIAMTISMDRVLATMLLYRTNVQMQSQGMGLLCMLCKESHRNRAKIASLYSLEVITKSLENCEINKEVQRHGTTLIQYLCQTEGNTVAAGLVSDGGMELLLNVIRRHGSDPIIVQQVDLIIAKMARPFSDTIRKEGGIELILSGMRRHETNIAVQEASCLALWKLSAKVENANVINGNGGVSLINSALSRFPTDENISEVACEALASLSHDKQMMLAQQTLKARAAQKKPESSWGNLGCGVSCF